MRYKLLGRSGLRVSELCLGTMTFGDDWGWGAPKEESRRIFDAYANAGGNFIDTANRYTEGSAERMLGEFIAADRDHFVVATKYTLFDRTGDPNYSGNHRKNMVRSLEGSLKRLNTEFVDLLYVHAWDSTTPIDEIMRGLDDLVRSGRVLYVAISDTPAWVISQANMLADLRGWSRFIAVQADYSLLNRPPERDLLPMARALDLAVTAWSVLGSGVLTGKYNRKSDEKGRAALWGEVNEKSLAIAQRVVDLAEEIGCTPAQVATSWVRQQPGVVLPIIGARTLAQIQDSLGALSVTLTPEQMQRLDDASRIVLGFPHDFLASEGVRNLMSGETWRTLDNHRQ